MGPLKRSARVAGTSYGVTCRGQRGEVCVPGRGELLAGARLAEGNNPGVWIEGRVLLAMYGSYRALVRGGVTAYWGVTRPLAFRSALRAESRIRMLPISEDINIYSPKICVGS